MHFLRRLCVPLLTLLALSGCKPKAANQPIWIGHVAPLSGPLRRTGEQAKQAITLAVTEANQDVPEGSARRVAVLHVDSRGQLEALQPEAVRLITVNRAVALLGGMHMAQVERLSRAAQPYRIPLFTPALLPPEAWAENVFSVNVSPAFAGQVLARFAREKKQAQRVALLTDGRRAVSTTLAEAFLQQFSQQAEAVGRQRLYQSEAELTKAIEELAEFKPQLILFAGAAADLAQARTLLQKAKLALPILCGDDGEYLPVLEADPKLAKELCLATPYGSEADSPELQRFGKHYQQEFHEAPSPAACLAYDGIRVLIQALRQGETEGTARTRLELASLPNQVFESLTGRLAFGKDHTARRPLFVVQFEEGKVRAVQRFDPEIK